MEYNITTIIQAVFALIAAVITVIVIPYIKSKTTAQQQAEINAWVKIAVSAAEQIYNGSVAVLRRKRMSWNGSSSAALRLTKPNWTL